MNKFLGVSIFFLIIFFVSKSITVENYLLSLLIALVFPLLFLIFLIKVDVFEKENFKDILYVFVFGLATSFFLCIPYVFIRDIITLNPLSDPITCFFLVAVPEEIIKIIPFLLVLKFRKYINEPIDYLIYASTTALGFAFYENINYLLKYSDSGNIVAIRSLLPSVMHMVVSSIFSFGIFLYVQSKKIKYIFIGLLLSSFIHAIYNTSFIFSPIILLIILSYYSKMIQSLLNISPFYEKSKEKFVGESTNFLFMIIFSILILSFLFDLFFNGFKSIINNFSSYLYLLVIPYFIYKILSSKLVLQKGRFLILGKRKNSKGIIKEAQEIIANYYKN